jgi:outer membrane protein assembly factor BamB
MKVLTGVVAAVGLVLCFAGVSIAEPAAVDNWPRWRGPLETGEAPESDPPIEWSEDKNVRWKLPIPGEGSSSPIVWGDFVYVTSAVDTGKPASGEAVATPAPSTSRRGRGPRGISTENIYQYDLFKIRRADGEIVWRRTAVRDKPHEGRHPTGTWASNSAVTDGERIYAYFGSRGLFAYDLEGNKVWERDLGDMHKRLTFGEGSSPALWGDSLVIIRDHEGDSFIVALDKNTGDEKWRVDREEQTSWTTPLIVDAGDGPQVITTATKQTRSYDLETGDLLWAARGVTMNAIPMPIEANGIVYVMSGFMGNALRALRLSDAAKSGEDAVVPIWEYNEDTPYVPSALLYDGLLYFLKSNNGVLTVLDAASGEKVYGPQRVEGLTNVYSSPVGASGRVYFTDRKGNTTVIKAGRTYEMLAQNSLDDDFDASAAVVGNEIYLRGANLYCLAVD